jgi:hypothetical protein
MLLLRLNAPYERQIGKEVECNVLGGVREVTQESVHHLRYAESIIVPRRAIVTRRGLHYRVFPLYCVGGCIIAAERVVESKDRR